MVRGLLTTLGCCATTRQRHGVRSTKTFVSQVDKVATRFGVGEITFVGDRGMIKGPQIKALHEEGLHFITAITNPQIEALLTQGILRMG